MNRLRTEYEDFDEATESEVRVIIYVNCPAGVLVNETLIDEVAAATAKSLVAHALTFSE